MADYVKLHKAAQAEIHRLKPTKSHEAIEHYEHHLAHRISEARTGVVQETIFTPEITAEFRRLIGFIMQGPEGVRIRQSLQSGSPVPTRAARVNHSYPSVLPLQSAPPSLLLNLPPLPPEVEYRVDHVRYHIDNEIRVDVAQDQVAPHYSLMRRAAVLLFVLLPSRASTELPELKQPLKANPVRFGVIGDSGTGDKAEYETAAEMAAIHGQFPFDFVIMLGDNIYGGNSLPISDANSTTLTSPFWMLA